jgi:glutamyl-tRNA synthetase
LIKQEDEDLAHTFALSLLQKELRYLKCTDKNCFLIKERAHFVSEFWELSDFFFVAPSEYDAKATKNWKATPALMQELIVVVDEITDFT